MPVQFVYLTHRFLRKSLCEYHLLSSLVACEIQDGPDTHSTAGTVVYTCLCLSVLLLPSLTDRLVAHFGCDDELPEMAEVSEEERARILKVRGIKTELKVRRPPSSSSSSSFSFTPSLPYLLTSPVLPRQDAQKYEQDIVDRQSHEEQQWRRTAEERQNRWYNVLLNRHQDDPVSGYWCAVLATPISLSCLWSNVHLCIPLAMPTSLSCLVGRASKPYPLPYPQTCIYMYVYL